MNQRIHSTAFIGILILTLSCVPGQKKGNTVRIENFPGKMRVDVTVDGKLFTSYVYNDTLKKPILFPVFAEDSIRVTRGFPMAPEAGESTDHPHQTGFWFNYGNVNGIDFWGNGSWIPDSLKHKYGNIRFKSIDALKNLNDRVKLSVTHEWVNSKAEVLLEENTTFSFTAGPGYRIIDRETKLTARQPEILFADTKEGAFAIRVAKFLEFPSKDTRVFLDADGHPTPVPANLDQGVSGNYLSSEGIEGVKVWSTRAKWMKLYGVYEKDTVSLVFMDHPANLNFPTYWHARDYGLFSANPFGVKDFTAGKEQFNFRMKKDESVSFRHRLYIKSGRGFPKDEIEKCWAEFSHN